MSNNTPDYNNNLAFAPGDWSDSRVVGNTDRTVSTIQLIEKIEKLEAENKELKTRLYNIWLECQNPFQEDNERILIDRLAYILHLSSVFEEKELDK